MPDERKKKAKPKQRPKYEVSRHGIGPSKELLIKLMEHYAKGRYADKSRVVSEETPDLPPQPSRFQRSPLIQGRPRFVKHATKLLDLDPRIKQGVKKVTIGPTEATIRNAVRFGLRPEEFEDTNVLGEAGLGSGEVAISPTLWADADIWPRLAHPNSNIYSNDKLNILAHELAHHAYGAHQRSFDARKINPDEMDIAKLIMRGLLK